MMRVPTATSAHAVWADSWTLLHLNVYGYLIQAWDLGIMKIAETYFDGWEGQWSRAFGARRRSAKCFATLGGYEGMHPPRKICNKWYNLVHFEAVWSLNIIIQYQWSGRIWKVTRPLGEWHMKLTRLNGTVTRSKIWLKIYAFIRQNLTT